MRTYLAGRRSLFAHYRTLLAKSRTGLAFIRTGVSCITISLLFLRIFGNGWLLFLEAPLLVVGCVMVYDGLKWYLPARQLNTHLPNLILKQFSQWLNQFQFHGFGQSSHIVVAFYGGGGAFK